jgi:hypothetical protein
VCACVCSACSAAISRPRRRRPKDDDDDEGELAPEVIVCDCNRDHAIQFWVGLAAGEADDHDDQTLLGRRALGPRAHRSSGPAVVSIFANRPAAATNPEPAKSSGQPAQARSARKRSPAGARVRTLELVERLVIDTRSSRHGTLGALI